MIGPSSSHTAGAARLALAARRIFGHPVTEVEFYLHGSFAETSHGHGTDRALVAGILGLAPDDERLPKSFELADELGLKYKFYRTDLGEDVHPNSVRMVLKGGDDEQYEVIGASVGGGNIIISELNGIAVEITGSYPTLVVVHEDRPGIVANVLSMLARRGINLAFMRLFREKKGSQAVLSVETDQVINDDILEEINLVSGVTKVRFIDKLQA